MKNFKKKLATLTGIVGFGLLSLTPAEALNYDIKTDKSTKKIKVISSYIDDKLDQTKIEQTLSDGTKITYMDIFDNGKIDARNIEQTKGNIKSLIQLRGDRDELTYSRVETKYDNTWKEIVESFFSGGDLIQTVRSVEKQLKDGTIRKNVDFGNNKEIDRVYFKKESANGKITEGLDLDADGKLDQITKTVMLEEGKWRTTKYNLNPDGSKDKSSEKISYKFIQESDGIKIEKYDDDGDLKIDWSTRTQKLADGTKKEYYNKGELDITEVKREVEINF